MKKSESAFKVLFSLIMFFCVLFLVWYIPAVHALTFRINDVRISLEMNMTKPPLPFWKQKRNWPVLRPFAIRSGKRFRR